MDTYLRLRTCPVNFYSFHSNALASHSQLCVAGTLVVLAPDSWPIHHVGATSWHFLCIFLRMEAATKSLLLNLQTIKKPKLDGIFGETTHSSPVSTDFTVGGTGFSFDMYEGETKGGFL